MEANKLTDNQLFTHRIFVKSHFIHEHRLILWITVTYANVLEECIATILKDKLGVEKVVWI
jgi:hypothetical protein